MPERQSSRPASTIVPIGAVLPAVAAVVSRRSLVVALAAIPVAALVFGLFPGLDLAVARLFYSGNGHFVGQGPTGQSLRRVFFAVPFAVLGLMLALFLARRAGWTFGWAPQGRGIAFLAITLALGPGLLVNTMLKDHSHRPRPMQVVEFGGALPFRPFYSFDGGCERNCSFVSGEASAAFWTVAAALLVPAAMQPVALAGALTFGIASGVLRMAFGGHFLSDTIFAALLTWLVIIGTWRALFGRQHQAGVKPIVNHDGRRLHSG